MSKETLVVLHLEGVGLVSSWLKDLVLSPERGIEYLYRGNLYKVAQSLQGLGESSSQGGNKLFRMLAALYPPQDTARLFPKLQHLGRDASSSLVMLGKTPGLTEEPERIILCVCRKESDSPFNLQADFPTAVSSATEATEPLVVFEVNGGFNSCWLKNMPMVPRLGSQFLRGKATFEVNRAIEVLTGHSSGETNQLATLITAIHGPSGGQMIANMAALDGDTAGDIVLVSNQIKLAKPERIVYLSAERVHTGSVLASQPEEAAS
jgi:hypothetical protein